MPILSIAEMEKLVADCEKELNKGNHPEERKIQLQITRLRSSIAAAKERGRG